MGADNGCLLGGRLVKLLSVISLKFEFGEAHSFSGGSKGLRLFSCDTIVSALQEHQMLSTPYLRTSK